jgi:hypothetical protein
MPPALSRGPGAERNKAVKVTNEIIKSAALRLHKLYGGPICIERTQWIYNADRSGLKWGVYVSKKGGDKFFEFLTFKQLMGWLLALEWEEDSKNGIKNNSCR